MNNIPVYIHCSPVEPLEHSIALKQCAARIRTLTLCMHYTDVPLTNAMTCGLFYRTLLFQDCWQYKFAGVAGQQASPKNLTRQKMLIRWLMHTKRLSGSISISVEKLHPEGSDMCFRNTAVASACCAGSAYVRHPLPISQKNTALMNDEDT